MRSPPRPAVSWIPKGIGNSASRDPDEIAIQIAEIGIVLVIALLVYGPKRLPELGGSLGRGMREFKDSITKRHEDPEPDQLTAAPAENPSATPRP
jgi:sec-independent protein translocase protein TatA